MSKNEQRNILKLMSIYVILQPLFDILSNLYLDGILKIQISTFVKPLFIFIVALYMFFKYENNKKRWFIYAFLFLIFMLGHYMILYRLYISNNVIMHEFRFLINIIYMIAIFIIYYVLYKHYEDKKEMFDNIKKTVLITFVIYTGLLLLSVITGTSGMTYEYADKFKKGFKGWYDSGQILGHAISIMFPILLYTILKPRNSWYKKILSLTPIIITIMILGTRTPYLIVLVSLIIYIIISIFLMFYSKIFKNNIFNLVFVSVCAISMVVLYKYTPVYTNVQINNSNKNTTLDGYNMKLVDGSLNIEKIDELIKNNKGNVTELKLYKKWNNLSTKYLTKLYKNGKIHPSENRKRQFYYSKYKFNISDIEYKLFGIGFLIQENTLSEESDFFMALFNYGIFGFICMLIIPILTFIKATIYIIKNFKTNDLETYLLYMGLGIFFSISILSGYTYIYTNFSIFLVLLIILLIIKLRLNESYKKSDKVKNLTFLALHLGYGGIETSTINTANALSKKYNVEIVSFYKLNNSRLNELDKKIKVKFLYNGEPNRDELKQCIKDKKFISLFGEVIKSIDILFKKKYLIIKEIINNKSDAIISTRMEFSKLLSSYGANYKIKIAQEHKHHNNDKKYINTIKNNYYNIDYLFALTTTLKNDYEKFLSKNNHTKVILVPNMITVDPNKKSDVKNKNIISVGRLHTGKRLNELIEIYDKANIKDSKLFIIGDGDEFNNLSSLIKEKKLEEKVLLLGYMNHDEIEEYMLNSSMFAMTSITEGLPMVLIEAMSYGVPCIAYETESGVSDIIDNGINGYIIKDRNEDKYVDTLEKYMSNLKIREKMKKDAIKKSQKFSKESILKIWVNVLSNKSL